MANKGFSRPKEDIQRRTFWLEMKRTFSDGRDEIDIGWVRLTLRVDLSSEFTGQTGQRKLKSSEWKWVYMKAAAQWVDAYRYPKNADSDEVPNHLFVYDANRDEVLAQLGLNPFECRGDKVEKMQVDSREPVKV